LKYLLLFVCSVFLSISVYCQTIVREGTLIIVTESKQGLVIVADRMTTTTSFDDNETKNNCDTVTKIKKVNKYFAFSLTGSLYYSKAEFNQLKEFDGLRLCSKYFEENNGATINADVIKVLANKLMKECQKFLNSTSQPAIIISNADETSVLNCLVYGYDVATKKYFLHIIALTYKVNNSSNVASDKFVVTYKCGQVNFDQVSRAIIIGKSGFASELQNGNNKKFDSLRKNKIATEYLNNKNTLFDKTDVVEYSKCLVTETSKVESKVGDKVDVAIIEGPNGFRWLVKDNKSID